MKEEVNPRWDWIRGYSDVSPCIELECLYDDQLKKVNKFCNYAVMLAQRILEHHKLKGKVSWGKWGARLETAKNPKLSERQLEELATVITNDDSWKALMRSTWVFTYGEQFEE